jgi:hypothetical protein
MADFVASSATLGNIQGICPECGTLMNRRVNVTKLDEVRGQLDVRVTAAVRHIGDSSRPSVNSDFDTGAA